jgi:integrase
MPRPAKGARLYLATEYIRDAAGRTVGEQKTWLIRDGSITRRTGCGEADRERAEKRLGEYISEKFTPAVRESDLARISVAEVLTAYGREHAPDTKGNTAVTIGYNIAALLPFWGDKTLADVRGQTCRDYAANRKHKTVVGKNGRRRVVIISDNTIRRELSVLAAAIGHWNGEHGPLNAVPEVTMPDKGAGRDRWLTRQEAALLLAGALGFYRCFSSDIRTRRVSFEWKRHRPAINRHAARFILIGLASGTRPGAIAALQWMPNTVGGWVNIGSGVLHRRGQAETETKKRRPPARLGRKILAHLARWKRLDDDARAKATEEMGGPVSLFLHVVNYGGRPVAKIRSAWSTAREFAWLDDKVTPHTLRHTRATWVMQQAIDLWEAAGHLGMSVKTLTDVYGHHHPDWQKEAAEV